MPGAPQGSPVSPLIANIVLHVLDEAWNRPGQRMGTLVRYCDDFVVLAPTKARAEVPQVQIEAILAPLGLRLHPDKTRVSCLRQGQEGFVFLGFEHRMRESKKWRSRWYLYKWPSPRAMTSIRAKVKGLFAGQGAHGQEVGEAPAGGRRRVPQSGAPGLGGVLLPRQFSPAVRGHRQLRAPSARHAGQQEVRTPWSELGYPFHL
jgi:hypothetical protein